jgi:uncharacterized protein YndB with AHSA1/START domain
MRSPEGQEFPNVGCYLEVIKNEKLVWTNALAPGYRPSNQSAGGEGGAELQFTAVITLESHGNGTKYTALAMHKDEEGCKKHAEMGFHEGWGKCFDQLLTLVKKM